MCCSSTARKTVSHWAYGCKHSVAHTTARPTDYSAPKADHPVEQNRHDLGKQICAGVGKKLLSCGGIPPGNGHVNLPATYVCDAGFRLRARISNLQSQIKANSEAFAGYTLQQRCKMLEALGMAWEINISDEAFEFGIRKQSATLMSMVCWTSPSNISRREASILANGLLPFGVAIEASAMEPI